MQTRILHDCTTLGGNSGSVVLDLDSGKALGLHFSGRFLTTNYAVRADVVKQAVGATFAAGRATRPEARVRRNRAPTIACAPDRQGCRSRAAGSASLTIPLTVTVSLGGVARTRSRAERYRALPAASVDDRRRHCGRG